MNIRISSGPAKKKPQVGDRKVIKGVMHERQLKRVKCPVTGANIGYDCTGGRQNYEWLPVKETAGERE